MINLKFQLGRRAPMGRPLQTRKGIRVEPRDDTMRKLLRHPKAGKFRATGSIEWPDDRYTHRRLADGSIRLATRVTSDAVPLTKDGEPLTADQLKEGSTVTYDPQSGETEGDEDAH